MQVACPRTPAACATRDAGVSTLEYSVAYRAVDQLESIASHPDGESGSTAA